MQECSWCLTTNKRIHRHASSDTAMAGCRHSPVATFWPAVSDYEGGVGATFGSIVVIVSQCEKQTRTSHADKLCGCRHDELSRMYYWVCGDCDMKMIHEQYTVCYIHVGGGYLLQYGIPETWVLKSDPLDPIDWLIICARKWSPFIQDQVGSLDMCCSHIECLNREQLRKIDDASIY